jgi:hypothetical protein
MKTSARSSLCSEGDSNRASPEQEARALAHCTPLSLSFCNTSWSFGLLARGENYVGTEEPGEWPQCRTRNSCLHVPLLGVVVTVS